MAPTGLGAPAKLPREVRDMIWMHVVGCVNLDDGSALRDWDKSKGALNYVVELGKRRPILETNAEVRRECLEAFLRASMFPEPLYPLDLGDIFSEFSTYGVNVAANIRKLGKHYRSPFLDFATPDNVIMPGRLNELAYMINCEGIGWSNRLNELKEIKEKWNIPSERFFFQISYKNRNPTMITVRDRAGKLHEYAIRGPRVSIVARVWLHDHEASKRDILKYADWLARGLYREFKHLVLVANMQSISDQEKSRFRRKIRETKVGWHTLFIQLICYHLQRLDRIFADGPVFDREIGLEKSFGLEEWNRAVRQMIMDG